MNTFRFFWYDRLVADINNIASPELEGLDAIVKGFKAVQVRSVPTTPCSNCLVFVHAQGQVETQWEGIANPSETRYVVLVGSVARTSNNVMVYCPRTPLTSIAKFLKEHPDKFESFKKSCEEGNPDWTVFEPVVYSDALVAYYIAMVANEQRLLEELKIEAAKDFEKLQAKHDCKGAFDRDGIKALFVKMAEK